MPQQDTITLTLAVLSTLILIRLVLPNILVALGLISLENGIAGGPQDANSYWPFRIDADLYREMLALGFQPEGTYWEQLPFTRRFEEFVFTRPGEKCFGILYPNDQIMPRRGSFLTVFETGGVVFTKNYCGGVEARQGDLLATGAQTDPGQDLPPQRLVPAWSPWTPIVFCLAASVLIATLVNGTDGWLSSDQRVVLQVLSGLAALATLFQFMRPTGAMLHHRTRQPDDPDLRISLAETLARHRLNVNRLLAEGQLPPASFNSDEFIATQQRYHRHPRIRIQLQSAMWTLLLVKLVVLAALPAIFFYRLGLRDPLPWGVLLIEGLVGLYLRYGCSSAQVLNILWGFRPSQKAS